MFPEFIYIAAIFFGLEITPNILLAVVVNIPIALVFIALVLLALAISAFTIKMKRNK